MIVRVCNQYYYDITVSYLIKRGSTPQGGGGLSFFVVQRPHLYHLTLTMLIGLFSLLQGGGKYNPRRRKDDAQS